MSSYRVGDEWVCVSSKSCAYTVNKVYKVAEERGVYGLYGNDGLFDPMDRLLSRFKLKPKVMITGVIK